MGAMELRPDSHGKVRDIYDCGDSLLMVASDRISAFDYILPDEIPYKGEILTRISAFWFNRFKDLMPNHLITMDVSEYPEEYQKYGEYLTGRSMLVKKAKTVPIECIVRGYLTGSGKKTYDQDGTVCGIKLPAGLTEASKIPEPIVHQGRAWRPRREHQLRALRRARGRGRCDPATRRIPEAVHRGCRICPDAWLASSTAS